MTVQENITKVTVTGPLAVGAIIPIPFQYINETDIKVEVDGTAYIYNVDYEVTLQNVEIKTAVEGPVSVTVYRDTPLDQQAEFPQNNKFNSAKMNEALDKMCMIQQEHKEELDRCLRVAIDTASQFDGLLPSPSSGKALMWDAEGEIINTPFTMTEIQASVNTAVSDSAAALTGANNAVTTANSASSTASIAAQTANQAYQAVENKQNLLISGVNIKTINDTSLLGSGDITIKYGADLLMSLDTTTYVLTLQLKDQDGNNLGTAQTIDLPIESLVLNVGFDSTTNELLITLQSGLIVRVPLGSIIRGLQEEITSTNKLSADLITDETTGNKFVSSEDKIAWNTAVETISGYGDIVSRDADEFAEAVHNHAISDVTNLQTTLNGKQASITSTNKLSADLLSEGTTNKLVSASEKTTWNNKQNAISDLSTIRSGASAGATAVQPGDLSTVAFSGSFTDLINTPSPVTESTVSGWGFTKNAGTVISVNSILPDGNGNVTIPISGAPAWGDIIGSISDQTDLQNSLNGKQATLVSGTNIKTINNVSLLGSGNVAVQPTITSSAMLSSDLVDDTGHTHKFATAAQLTQISTNTTDISTINGKIPAEATTSNKLADKAFVNSTVQTATANFRGNWGTWANVPTSASSYPVDYAGSSTPTVNDYLVVQDASGYTEDILEGTWRFKYSGTWATNGKSGWLPEYQVNETPLTSAQLAALNSGITSSDVPLIGTALQPNDNISALNNDAGYTSNVGTVTKVNNTSPDSNGNVTISIPSISNLADKDLSNLSTTGNAKFQAPLISGTNIKTINNNSILGSGNLTLDGLPTQTGQSGKFLTTNGTNASWATVTIPTVDQTYDDTSTRAQSGVAIAGAGFLKNTATGANAITINGVATTDLGGINIGESSAVNSIGGVAIGRAAEASAYAIGLGLGAKATSSEAIQIGYGTNSTAYTLSIGFYAPAVSDRKNWELLDGSTGLIPDARISTNIARTSALSNMQTTTNLVTSVSSSSTDSQYPSAKLFYDTVGTIEDTLDAIISGRSTVTLTVVITNTSGSSVKFNNNGSFVFTDSGSGTTQQIEVEKDTSYVWSCVWFSAQPPGGSISPSSGTIVMDSDKTLNITVSGYSW